MPRWLEGFMLVNLGRVHLLDVSPSVYCQVSSVTPWGTGGVDKILVDLTMGHSPPTLAKAKIESYQTMSLPVKVATAACLKAVPH